MAATAFLSMWVSNTATTMMLVPIGFSLIAVVMPEDTGGANGKDRVKRNFAAALVLGIAYAASIGGIGTLIGTPPNALLAAFMAEQHGVDIGFAQWMLLGLPLAIVMLAVAWLALTRIAFPFRNLALAESTALPTAQALGPWTPPEKRVATIGVAIAALWIARPLIQSVPGLGGISDPGIALFGGLALFALPAGTSGRERLLDWPAVQQLPWGILLLFGGGLSLAGAVASSGLADWIGGGLADLATWPRIGLVLAVVVLVILLTELTSNTATTAAFLPVLAAVAVQANLAPLALAAPAAIAASCAFMLPVATPPNAIVYGSGHISVPQMVRAGL